MSAQKETMEFQTEVRQLLKLMIHSLYSNKEIFLRELVSNASDALDKLRFESVKDDKLNEGGDELAITVSFDKDENTVTISDNGIGMTRDEVIANIGTIANSGTKKFLEQMTEEQSQDSALIGQFGVGFYSSFIVADKVILETRKAGHETAQGVRWESTGEGDFTLEDIEKADKGTSITLYLRDDENEFADGFRLRHIIRTYSDHITFPVMMQKEAMGEEEQTDEMERVNSAQALWTRSKDEISEEEYKEFYKTVSHDYAEPLAHVHSKVEGNQEYTSLFYIPKNAPFDLWDRDNRHGIKLYVKRVFIMDDSDHLMPNYLRFIRGLVDSNDLPLNVSREILQGNRVIDKIRAASVKKVLGMINSMAKAEDQSDFETFWKNFGLVMKEGIVEDTANKDKIAKLLRFSTTQDDSADQKVSLEEYVARMQEGQEAIYYITADSHEAAKGSPHLEIFREKGVEVLLLSDRIDEWLTTHLTEFDGKPLKSVTKGDLDLGDLDSEEEKEAQKAQEEEKAPLIEKLKEALGEQVKDVKITHRLKSSPACLVADENDMGANMERILAQMGQDMPGSKPILEINPNHAIIDKVKDIDGDALNDWAQVLFDQALLAEGGQLKNPADFVARMNKLLA